MGTHFKPWETHTEYGVHYLFDSVGDGIPMHAHIPGPMLHSTRCLKGSCAIYGDGIDAVLHPGETLDFKSYRMHELAALEAGTEIVNVMLAGKPKDYAGVSEETLSGHVASVLMGRYPFDAAGVL